MCISGRPKPLHVHQRQSRLHSQDSGWVNESNHLQSVLLSASNDPQVTNNSGMQYKYLYYAYFIINIADFVVRTRFSGSGEAGTGSQSALDMNVYENAVMHSHVAHWCYDTPGTISDDGVSQCYIQLSSVNNTNTFLFTPLYKLIPFLYDPLVLYCCKTL